MLERVQDRRFAKLDSELEEHPVWERLRGENSLWFSRFLTYLKLGPQRSVQKARRASGNGTANLWDVKSRDWRWLERATAWDNEQARVELAKRQEIMTTGLAAAHERVLLLREIAQRDARIYRRVQQRMEQEEVDREGTSNASHQLSRRLEVIGQRLDSDLTQIAQEVGGRVKRISIEKELDAYAIELAKAEGYDIDRARALAKQIIEGESRLLE